MSLIEREKLLEHLNACLAESDGKTPITDAVLVAIRCAVEQMPEVDAVPVVRCGECELCNDFGHEGWCKRFDTRVGTDGYCHYGERRKDNG